MSSNGTDDGRERGSVSRRRFVTAAGASGAAAGLAGCAEFIGGGDGDGGGQNGTTTGDAGGDGTTTIRWGIGPTAVETAGEEMKTALHEAGGLSDDIEIEWVPSSQDTGEVRTNYNRILDSGQGDPDILQMDNGWVNIFIQRGLIQNLSETLSDDTLSTIEEDYFTGFTDTARDPESGDLYGVPLFPDFPTMQYRKDLVEEAGYDPEGENWATEPMTWEEWSHIAADVYDNADVDYGFTTQWDIYEGTACCTFNEVMSSWGGAYFGGRENLFGPVGERPITVDEPNVVQSLNMMRKFVHDEDFGGEFENYAGGFTPTDILGWLEETSRSPFAQGNAVFHRNWPYSLALTGRNPEETEDPALGQDLGAMPIPYAVPESEAPQPGTGGTTSALGGWHLTFNPNSDNLDVIEQVVQAVMSPDFALELFRLQGWLPPRPELFNSDEAQEVEPVGRYLDTLQVAGENVMARPVTPVWSQESQAIAQQANRAVGQEVSSEQAMSSLASSLQDIEQG
ncbi:extracellular solute-binding protein [Halomicrobium salinisoli]|uniref:extracellular solute-binding protein n=1 Tax=Halomicrobium salinisoli TaxID=2878391 RepID=UPI001CF0BB0D|nr:extracellular solute-binding protein [Halomicrobium salinisoli]